MIAVLLTLAVAQAPGPVRLAADVDDAYSLRINPAGLGYLRGNEFRLLYARGGGNLPDHDSVGVYGAVQLGALRLGAGYDYEHQSGAGAHHPRLGFALGGKALSLGFSWDRRTPFIGEAKTAVNAGLTIRWNNGLSTAVAVWDLGQNRARRAWDLSLALRPTFVTDRLLLSSQLRLTQGLAVNSDTLDLRFYAAVEPVDGINVGVATNVDLDVFLQLGIDFSRSGIGGFVNSVDSDLAAGGELTFHSARPSIFRRARVGVITLAGGLVPDPDLDLLGQKLTVTAYQAAPLQLQALARSNEVAGILVRIAPLKIGWAKAMEVRAGLAAIRASGKRVDCLLGGVRDIEYYVASACDEIIVAPPAMLRVNGVSAEILYFGEALGELGVKAEVVRHGAYKSSPDQFTRSSMSAQQREALGAYLDVLYELTVDTIASARKLERDQVIATLDEGVLTSSEALSRGFVDHVLYPDQVEKHLERRYGVGLRLADAAELVPPPRPRWRSPDRIAIVHVDAAIASGPSRDLPFGLGKTAGAATIIAALERARLDPSIRAVVLRVDSPGGDSLASDVLARAVQQLADEKPVVASFGDVAASGGYYVAAHATEIYAQPTTLTGSIGVFFLRFSPEQLLARLGIFSESVDRGRFSGASSNYTDHGEAERKVIAKGVDSAYEQFLGVIAQGRKMDREKVRAAAEGRIHSGTAAQALGLVDQLGGLTDAISRARVLAGFSADERVQLTTLPNTRKPLPSRLAAWMAGEPPQSPAVDLGRIAPWLSVLVGEKQLYHARLPWTLEVD